MTSQYKPLNFCFDSLSDPDLGYPNLAKKGLAPDEFDNTWPCVLPVRLFAYFPMLGMRHYTWLVDQAPQGSLYPVGLGWHDFDCDYFSLLPPNTYQAVKQGRIKLLFYYHEGDNPQRIKTRFDHLVQSHNFPDTCYVFVSANSASATLPRFIYFPDHELFFRYINKLQKQRKPDALEPTKHFTILNRTHKWWRATAMSDLHREGLLDNSDWSYNYLIDIGDRPEDNPICIDAIPGLETYMHNFLSGSPYVCDEFESEQQNDHRIVNEKLYRTSLCHVVFETHFDADQSQGTFLTEKTYKCIKFGQPFVVVGPPYSLAALRVRGYRTFDSVIDNSYDEISDNTQRWLAVKKTLAAIKSRPMKEFYKQCQADVLWNQNHFMHSHGRLLQDLVYQLHQLSTGTL